MAGPTAALHPLDPSPVPTSHAYAYPPRASPDPSKPDAAFQRPDSAHFSTHLPRTPDRSSVHSNGYPYPYAPAYPYPYPYPYRPQSIASHHSHHSHPSTARSLPANYTRPYDARYSSPRASSQQPRLDAIRPHQSRIHSDSSGHESVATDSMGPQAKEEQGPEVLYSTYSEDDEEKVVDTLPTRHIAQALIHVSLVAPLLSVGIALYTVLAVLFATLTTPIRLLISQHRTYRKITGSLLAAPLRLQLRCVFASTSQAEVRDEEKQSPWPGQKRRSHKSHLPDRPGLLVLTHLFAPLAAVPIALCAWVVAFFWACSATVNDEGGHGDGRSLAMTVIDWWVWWLEGRMFR